MTQSEKDYLIRALRILLQIDDIHIMKYTIESLLDKIEDDARQDQDK